jgi:hypothetical protein
MLAISDASRSILSSIVKSHTKASLSMWQVKDHVSPSFTLSKDKEFAFTEVETRDLTLTKREVCLL